MSLVSELDHLTAKHRKAQGLKSAFLLVKMEGHLGSCQGNLKIRQGPKNTHSWDPQGQTWASWRSRLIFPAAVPSVSTILWLLCIVCLIRLWARPYQCPSNLEAAKWLLRRWRGARRCLDTAPVSASFSCILLFFNTHSLEERLYPKGDVVLVLVAVTSIWGEATWRRKDLVVLVIGEDSPSGRGRDWGRCACSHLSRSESKPRAECGDQAANHKGHPRCPFPPAKPYLLKTSVTMTLWETFYIDTDRNLGYFRTEK